MTLLHFIWVYDREVIHCILLKSRIQYHYIENFIHVLPREHVGLANVYRIENLFPAEILNHAYAGLMQVLFQRRGAVLANEYKAKISVHVYVDENVQLELLGHPGKAHGLKFRTVLYQLLIVRVQVDKE